MDNTSNFNLSLTGLSSDADVRLIQDVNSNGIVDDGDEIVRSAWGGSNDESINRSLAAGTYFAQVYQYSGDTNYNLNLSATAPQTPSNLLPVEVDLGTLSDTQTYSNNVSSTDTADVYRFSMDNTSNFNLSLTGLSSDADVRLIQDVNSNGIVDDGDEIARSSLSDSQDELINRSLAAGTYFAQVYQYSGDTNYNLSLSVTSCVVDVPTTYLPFDSSQVFNLNSNADANHIIYLDFDGHTTTGTAWNNQHGNNIVTPAFDTDGNTSSFSNDELETIWRIWQRVSEDFSPFNVNVTTQAPSSDQLINSGSGDTQWGIRVAIGGSSTDWFGNAGGVAYLDSFNWDTDTPAFVFENDLGDSNEKSTAEVISHEVGHTLGLSHDGTSSVEYYSGHGSGATGWAPIMGVGYDRELTQWSRGEYSDAGNQEDDLDIITGQNGFGYRADDYSDSLNNAAALVMNGSSVETYGIIEQNTDYDWFSFTTTTGDLNLSINAFERGANLDILAELYNSAGQLVQSANPVGSLSASFAVNLDPGEYFFSVTGTGQGSPTIGYSDYGSLGQYSITGSLG
jgi:hypothetical protein